MSAVHIDASLLKGLFEAVKPAIQRNSPMPVATHVRITIDGGVLSLRSTDGALYMTAKADIEDDGESHDFCVPPDRLSIALAACADQLVLQIEPGHVVFKNGRSRLQALTLSAELFPELTPVEFSGEYLVTGLGASIERALFVVDPANVRPQMQGVWLDSSTEQLAIAGAGMGGATMAIQCMQGDFEERRLMIPHSAAKIAARFGEATVRLAGARVRMECENVTLEFPPANVPLLPWRQALPKTDRSFTVARAPLLAALSQCQSFKAGDKISYANLKFDGEQLSVSTDRPGEEYQTYIQATGDAFEAGFSTKQLQDGLNHAHGEEVTIAWSSAGESHLNARLLVEGGWQFIVMPLKL